MYKDRFISLVVGLALLIGTGSWLVTAADPADDEETVYICTARMRTEGQEAVDDFNELLNEFFLSDVDTSDQIEKSYEIYRTLEEALNAIYIEDSVPREGSTRSIEDTSADSVACAQARDQYLRYARALLQAQIKGSSNSKRTFRMRDGLDILNNNLDEFSNSYFEVFPGKFKQFDNALPCYAKQCI